MASRLISGICDFCSAPRPAWRYPCTSFDILAIFQHRDGSEIALPWGSIGDWAACEYCSDLIENENWDDLAQHSFNASPALNAMDRSLVEGEVVKASKALHVEFRARKQERVKL